MDEKSDIKKEYEILSRKYKLPGFEELDNEFEVSSIEDINKKFLIRIVRRRINDKMTFFNRILESILQPNTGSFVHLHESKFFSDEEKQEILISFRKLMRLERESLGLDINPDAEKDAEFINKVFREFNEMKKRLRKVSSILEEAWSKEEEKVVSESYFG